MPQASMSVADELNALVANMEYRCKVNLQARSRTAPIAGHGPAHARTRTKPRRGSAHERGGAKVCAQGGVPPTHFARTHSHARARARACGLTRPHCRRVAQLCVHVETKTRARATAPQLHRPCGGTHVPGCARTPVCVCTLGRHRGLGPAAAADPFVAGLPVPCSSRGAHDSLAACPPQPWMDAEGEGAFGVARHTPFPPGSGGGGTAASGAGKDARDRGAPRVTRLGAAAGCGDDSSHGIGLRPSPRRPVDASGAQRAGRWEMVPAIGGSLATPPMSPTVPRRSSREKTTRAGGGGSGGGLLAWFGGLLQGGRRGSRKASRTGRSWPRAGSADRGGKQRAATPAGFTEGTDGVFSFELAGQPDPDSRGLHPRSG